MQRPALSDQRQATGVEQISFKERSGRRKHIRSRFQGCSGCCLCICLSRCGRSRSHPGKNDVTTLIELGNFDTYKHIY